MLALCVFFFVFALCDLPPSEKAIFSQLCANTNVATYNSNPEHINWCTSANICDWHGVTCNVARTSVLNLRFVTDSQEFIDGELPPSFAALANLEILLLQGLATTATLTPQFVGLNSHLNTLLLYGVPISGVFSFDRFPASMKRMSIGNTLLTGPLVGNLNRFGQFNILEFEGPGFTGTLPSDLLTKFDGPTASLSITHTQIGGVIPDSMCITNCANIVLKFNRFTDRPLCLTNKLPGTCSLRENPFCVGPRPEDGACIVTDPPIGVFDQCSVCSGNGQSCVDCAGNPFGGITYDVCDICGGSATLIADCPPDCAGVPHGSSVYDQCDVCGGNGSTCKDCTGVANGPSVYDVCDVCNGNGASCIDCLGILLGTSSPDACDVCNGDGSSCLDCSGVANGPNVYDACDVCGGDDSSCSDCLGVPYGTKVYDRCDLCGGDGTLCGLDFIVANSQSNTIFIVLVTILMLILIPILFIAILYRRTIKRK